MRAAGELVARVVSDHANPDAAKPGPAPFD